MSVQKELPISMQSFNQIISGDCIYVDKTKHIYNLAKSRKLYLLKGEKAFSARSGEIRGGQGVIFNL